jgi:hypothetical protein
MRDFELRPDATYAEVRAWLRARDPELDAACDEVDTSLIADTLRLSVRERLRRFSATASWFRSFQARARVVR